MPEIRSATNFGTMPFSQPLMQMFGQNNIMGDIPNNFRSSALNGEDNDLGILNSMRESLLNLTQLDQGDSPTSDESREFFDFIDYLLRRINQLPSQAGLQFQSGDHQQSPRIQDYIRNLNLLNSNDESMLSNMLSYLFQSLNFQDLYQMINSNFRDFARLRQHLQRAIRVFLMNNHDGTDVRTDIETMIANHPTLLTDIVVSLIWHF